jgi:hypothetical protein
LIKLVFGWFFEIELENVLTHDRIRWEKMGIDAERYEKIGKDRNRYKKIGKDGGCIEECCFHVMLQTRRVFNEFPCLWGSRLVSDLRFGFCF